MVLILCDVGDMSALWLTARLQERGTPVELVTAPALGAATRWRHTIEAASATVEITLADGRTLSSVDPMPVINRLTSIPTERLRLTAGADFGYAVQELFAFYLSWLHAWPMPMLNRPTPQGLCGQHRHASEWAILAARAGLPTRGWTQSSAQPLDLRCHPTPAEATAFVVGATVVMPPALPSAFADGCRALRAGADTALLGIGFARDGEDWVVTDATPVPELMYGGDPLVSAIAGELGL